MRPTRRRPESGDAAYGKELVGETIEARSTGARLPSMDRRSIRRISLEPLEQRLHHPAVRRPRNPWDLHAHAHLTIATERIVRVLRDDGHIEIAGAEAEPQRALLDRRQHQIVDQERRRLTLRRGDPLAVKQAN